MEIFKSLSGVFDKIADYSSKSLLPWIILVVLTSILLFVDPTILEKFLLKDLRQQYGSIIGLIFLASSIILVIFVVLKIKTTLSSSISGWKSKRNESRELEHRVNFLHQLTPKQQYLLFQYFAAGSVSELLPSNDAEVLELEENGIIHKKNNIVTIDRISGRGYVIDSWARDYISNNMDRVFSDLNEN